MFGSFAIGEGDAFSDIEFAVFIQDDSFEDFEQRSWLNAVSPVAAYLMDDFGHHTALFENGIRGEFHFMRKTDIPIISTWQGYGWFPSLDAYGSLSDSNTESRVGRLKWPEKDRSSRKRNEKSGHRFPEAFLRLLSVGTDVTDVLPHRGVTSSRGWRCSRAHRRLSA